MKTQGTLASDFISDFHPSGVWGFEYSYMGLEPMGDEGGGSPFP